MKVIDIVGPDVPIVQFRDPWLAIGVCEGRRIALLRYAGMTDPVSTGDLDEALVLLGWRRVGPWLTADDGAAVCLEIVEHQPADPQLAADARRFAESLR